MKLNIIESVFSFSFKSDKCISESFKSAMELHYTFLLLTIAVIRVISPKNEKGVKIDDLFFAISSVTDVLDKLNYAAVLNSLQEYGFLYDKSKDKNTTLYFLANQNLGEYAKSELSIRFPDISSAVEQLAGIDIDVIRKAAESEVSDTKH